PPVPGEGRGSWFLSHRLVVSARQSDCPFGRRGSRSPLLAMDSAPLTAMPAVGGRTAELGGVAYDNSVRQRSWACWPAGRVLKRPIVRRSSSVLLPEPATMNPPGDLGPAAFTDVSIPSDTTEARRVQDEIEQQLVARRATDQEIFSIRLALEEALV